jgi:Flp pilus assembly pilin Flp
MVVGGPFGPDPISTALRQREAGRGVRGDHRLGRKQMLRNIASVVSRLGSEQEGGEVLEYALIAGLIVVAAIGAITVVGTKVLGYWNTISGSSF